MNRIPIADWAAQAPWEGISNKPSWVGTAGPIVDLSAVTWNGVPAQRYPVWNGIKFIPTVVATGPGGGGTKIKDGDQPAIAVRRRPPGNPTEEFENVWQRFVFNVKLYGAIGQGTDDLQAINSAIHDLNAAGQGMLYFPAGRYACSAPPDRITGFAMVKGDGIGVTTLIFDGLDGLSFQPATAETFFGADGFSVEQVGTALNFIGGSAQVGRIAVRCKKAGIVLGNSVAPLVLGSVRDSYFVADEPGAVGIKAYGDGLDLHDVSILGSGQKWDQGVSLEAGLYAAFHDVYIANTDNEAIFLGSSVLHARIQNIVFGEVGGAVPVNDLGSENYVNELFGVGGNTNPEFDNRKELYSIFAWNPGSVPAGFGFYEDFSVPGAAFGDQCVLGAPYSFYEGVSSDIRVIATDTVRAILYNVGTATVNFSSGNWKMRVFN